VVIHSLALGVVEAGEKSLGHQGGERRTPQWVRCISPA
jgi:hypothetical protein